MKTEPWHTLIVTGLYYHNDPACPGHTHPDDDTCDDDIAHELEHPDDCLAEHPCCHDANTPASSLLEAFTPKTCDACLHGAHENCSSKPFWRCATDEQVYEYYTENELPTVPGTYRVRGWWSGPDYFGEYDNGADLEDVSVPAAPTEPATCKRDPWPKVQMVTPRIGAVRFELLKDGEPA